MTEEKLNLKYIPNYITKGEKRATVLANLNWIQNFDSYIWTVLNLIVNPQMQVDLYQNLVNWYPGRFEVWFLLWNFCYYKNKTTNTWWIFLKLQKSPFLNNFNMQ